MVSELITAAENTVREHTSQKCHLEGSSKIFEGGDAEEGPSKIFEGADAEAPRKCHLEGK